MDGWTVGGKESSKVGLKKIIPWDSKKSVIPGQWYKNNDIYKDQKQSCAQQKTIISDIFKTASHKKGEKKMKAVRKICVLDV